MEEMNVDCSFAAAIFAFIYTFINAILFLSSLVALYKFIRDYKSKKTKKPPKVVFYPGLLFFIFSSMMLLVTLRNSMFICFHGDINYMDISEWIIFIIFYGLQTYQLWLVLFLRLRYVFQDSAYALSSLTIRLHTIIFIVIPFIFPIYILILWWWANSIIYTIILLLSFIFIVLFSFQLSILFIYKLMQVFKNMDIDLTSLTQINNNENSYNSLPSNTPSISSTNTNTSKTQTKRRKKKSKSINKNSTINNKLLSTITKSTLLAVISLTITLFVPPTLIFGYYSIIHSSNKVIFEIGTCILAVVCLFDVYSNLSCIALSYLCFDPLYLRICHECDNKFRKSCLKMISKKKLKEIEKKKKKLNKKTTPNITNVSVISPSVTGDTDTNTNNIDINTDDQLQYNTDNDTVNDYHNYHHNIHGTYEQVDTDNYDDTMEMTVTQTQTRTQESSALLQA